jgi:hypothetical protein
MSKVSSLKLLLSAPTEVCSTGGTPLRVRQSPAEGNPPAVLNSPHRNFSLRLCVIIIHTFTQQRRKSSQNCPTH